MNFTIDFTNCALYLILFIGLAIGSVLGGLIETSSPKSLRWIIVGLLYPFILLVGLPVRFFKWVDRQTQFRSWFLLLFTSRLDHLNDEQLQFSRTHLSYSKEFNPVRRWFLKELVKAVDKRNGGKILAPCN